MRLLLKEKFNLFYNKKCQATKPGVFVLKARIANPRDRGCKSALSLWRHIRAIGINGTIQDKAKNYIQDSELLLQFEKIEKLPEAKKQLVKEFLDAFILKSNLQQQLT